MNMSNLFVLGASLSVCGCVAMGDVVSFYSDASTTSNSSATGVSLNGSIEYNYSGGNSGSLVFSIINTTDASVGGFFTGLVFNLNSADSSASATLSSSSDSDFADTGSEDANPFGTFDAGAAVGA